MVVDYSKKFSDLTRKYGYLSRLSDAREGIRDQKGGAYAGFGSPAKWLGVAHAKMNVAIKCGNLSRALDAYTAYEQAGKGKAHYALNGLLKTYEFALKHELKILPENLKTVRKILAEVQPSPLEKTAATAAIIGVIGGISLLSTSITGNVIGYATVAASSVLGAALLIVGLTAGFFWVSNRKSK